MKVVPLKNFFAKMVDYEIYRLHDRSTRYNTSIAKPLTNIQCRLDIQMKKQNFSGEDPISALNFLTRLCSGFATNGIYENATLWCF